METVAISAINVAHAQYRLAKTILGLLLSIGNFTKYGWVVRAGRGWHVAGAVVECFVSHQSEGEGFFGVFGDA